VKLAFLREAEDEVNQAIAYYEEIEHGLGIRLKEETRRLGQWIEHNSTVPPPRPAGYRRMNLKVFPYYIAYFDLKNCTVIDYFTHGVRLAKVNLLQSSPEAAPKNALPHNQQVRQRFKMRFA
jgi:hypothetical protein